MSDEDKIHRNSLGYAVQTEPSNDGPKIVWAEREDGTSIHIDAVNTAEQHRYSCSWGRALIPKKGPVRANHFAHAVGENLRCGDHVIAAIKNFVGSILARNTHIRLPPDLEPVHYEVVDYSDDQHGTLFSLRLEGLAEPETIILYIIRKARPIAELLEQHRGVLNRILIINLEDTLHSTDAEIERAVMEGLWRRWLAPEPDPEPEKNESSPNAHANGQLFEDEPGSRTDAHEPDHGYDRDRYYNMSADELIAIFTRPIQYKVTPVKRR